MFKSSIDNLRSSSARPTIVPSRGLRAVLLAAIVLVVALGYRPVVNLAFTVRLLLAVRALASGATGGNLEFQATPIKQIRDGLERSGVLYAPTRKRPERALLLVAGISPQGCYHPRLMALARTLADLGFLVLTPDVQGFRRFQVTLESTEEIAYWLEELRRLPETRGMRTVGIAGISFSATLSLIVAARPEYRDSVSYVLGIGAYEDLSRCTKLWFAATPRTMGEGYYPTRYYGRWIIMLSALDLLASAKDRETLKAALDRFLNGDTKSPTPPGSLTAEGERWLRFAEMREDESDSELSHSIEAHLAPLFQRLSPRESAGNVRCPVFLAHGAYDDLIPAEESVALGKLLSPGRAHLLISPFLTHTHPLDRGFPLAEKAAAVSHMLTFFYPLGLAAQ